MINHATPPPKPPAIVQQAPPTPTLKMIEVVSQGHTYFIPASVACDIEGPWMQRGVQQPSGRITVVLSCDSPGATVQIPDEQPAATTKR